MKLSECTKADLLYILEQLEQDSRCRSEIESLLLRVESSRDNLRFLEAQHVLNRSKKALEDYNKLIAQWEGVPLKDIPDDVVHRMNELLSAHISANGEWLKLMGITPKGGIA